MAVNLSPVGGVAGQFFDNNGDPLVGGKLFTYAAGTTTPQVTYTSSSGTTPNSNPIILNAGGRVPSEIWLTDGLVYKFVLYSSTDQLIGSWDNIVGINSNFVNFVTSEEVQIATAGQTVFTLTTMSYQPGLNNLVVYVDGVNQVEGGSYSFVETNSTTVTFTSGLHLGAVVKFVSAETLTTVGSNANVVAYEPAGVGAQVTTVQAKLRETVSVKDFGAVGDGVTDDTAAIQAAIDFCILQGKPLYVPAGIYSVSDTLTVQRQSTEWDSFAMFGDGQAGSGAHGDPPNNIMAARTIIEFTKTGGTLFNVKYTDFFFESISCKDIAFRQPNNTAAYQTGLAFFMEKDSTNYARKHNWENVQVYGFDTFVKFNRVAGNPATGSNFFGPITFDRVYAYGNLRGIDVDNVNLNLFVITRSLFHGCVNGAIFGQPSSGMNLMIRDTHFESCSPAVQPGQFETKIGLDNVSAEGCGTTTGFGVVGVTGTTSLSPLQLSFNNNLYGIILGPDELRFDRGTRIRSDWELKAAGAFYAKTPETIIPVIADNATYGQSDKFTFFKTDLEVRDGRLGTRPFKYLGGFSTSLNGGISPNNSSLPQAIRPFTVGAKGSRVFYNQGASAETFTAPVDGYIYASFAANVTDSSGVFFPAGTQITIDGVDQPYPTVRLLSNGVGIYTIMYRLNAGQVLSNFRVELTTSVWRTPMYITFEPTLLTAAQAASLLPRAKIDTYSIADSGSQIIFDAGDVSPAPYSVRVRMTFNNGSAGVFEYLVYGNGTNSSRVYVTTVNSVAAGISVSNSNNLNTDLFYITVANTTGGTLSMQVETEYLS